MSNLNVLHPNNNVNLKFNGKFFNVCKKIYNGITPKYPFNVKTPTEPCVYVCRHLNLHAALTINKCSTFDMQTYVLHVFTNQKSCFKQFYNYTFSKRCNKSKFFALFLSFIGSLFVPLICTPTQTIQIGRAHV